MSKSKKVKRRKKQTQTPLEIEQQKHLKMIRSTFECIGFTKVANIEGKEFNFKGITSELDDVFYLENVIILMEYTVDKTPKDHLKKKLPIYGKICENHIDFLNFVKSNEKLKSLGNALNDIILQKYSPKEIQLRIFYASKYEINSGHKGLAPHGVLFFDYSTMKYFDIFSKVARKSTRYEFLEFSDVNYDKFGDNVKKTQTGSRDDFDGHILPEEKSYFDNGYKIVTFYIDAQSLLQRAYVLRNDSWRNVENIELYQRLLIPRKIRQMRKYLIQQKRVFINNIIVTLSANDILLYDQKGMNLPIEDDGEIELLDNKAKPAKISIANKANIIGIIDGQHRVFAYHEGNDTYEPDIAKLRVEQNLLVTGIILPRNIAEKDSLMFQAKIFLEINANQQGASSQLKQTIDSILNPASATSISKYLIIKLNESGPLRDKFEISISDEHKIKTSSIISFALNLLIRPDGKENLWKEWDEPDKNRVIAEKADMEKLQKYEIFCLEIVRVFFISVAQIIDDEKWKIASKKNNGILNVTTINGFINCLRIIVAQNQLGDNDFYCNRLAKLNEFPFKNYKSSQYRKMGRDLYEEYFSSSTSD